LQTGQAYDETKAFVSRTSVKGTCCDVLGFDSS
jgi:hypothetical protein